MGKVLWILIMAAISFLFTELGIHARERKSPMWFNPGKPVDEDEISDVRAYNKKNGTMWLSFSGILWLCTLLGIVHVKAAGYCMIAACLAGVFLLPSIYNRILEQYSKKPSA